MMKVKTKKDTEYISLYRELIVLEPSGNVDLTATLCRKEKNKSPDQKYCFAVGSLLLPQGIGISTVIYRPADAPSSPKPTNKKFIFSPEKISSYFEE